MDLALEAHANGMLSLADVSKLFETCGWFGTFVWLA